MSVQIFPMKPLAVRVASATGFLACAISLAGEPVPQITDASPASSNSAPESASAKPVVTRENAPTFYRDYQRLTTHPQLVAPLTGILCGLPGKAQLDKEKAMTGPHARTFVHYYANPEAAAAISAKPDSFPLGAVIVKEKLAGGKTVTDIGGMIKRAPGYDPANGDWEFFSRSASGEFTSGKTANCIDCHNNAPHDHVFSVWKFAAH
jgi:hypothetical protein